MEWSRIQIECGEGTKQIASVDEKRQNENYISMHVLYLGPSRNNRLQTKAGQHLTHLVGIPKSRRQKWYHVVVLVVVMGVNMSFVSLPGFCNACHFPLIKTCTPLCSHHGLHQRSHLGPKRVVSMSPPILFFGEWPETFLVGLEVFVELEFDVCRVKGLGLDHVEKRMKWKLKAERR